MNAPTPPSAAEPVPVELDMEAEISKLVVDIPESPPRVENDVDIPESPPRVENDVDIPKSLPRVGNDVERIRSSVTRLASNSVDGLEGLTSELQELQKFLKSEVEHVQSEIESALEGIKIIIEAIAPWRNTSVAPPPHTSTRVFRAGPAANIKL